MGDSGLDVVARCGGWQEGDDDLLCHCLILRNGQLLWLMQGPRTVTLRQGTASAAALAKLLASLTRLTKGWPAANFMGTNFIDESDETAVLGTADGDAAKAQRYYAAPKGSDLERLVREIAGIG